MKESELKTLLEEAELQIEQAADQGDEEMAHYWDTRRKLIENQLKSK